jgi:hypothetical protein
MIKQEAHKKGPRHNCLEPVSLHRYNSIRISSQKIHRLINRIKEIKPSLAEHGDRVENDLVEPRHTNNRTSFDVRGVITSDLFKFLNGFATESASA